MEDTTTNDRSTPRLDAITATTEGTWVRHGLVDVAGDLVAGVLLSQIAYWFGWDRKGRDRLTVEREGHRWLAKANAAWWEECRVTEDQARRAVKALSDRGLVETRVWKFNGTPMVHVRLLPDAVEDALELLDPSRDDPESTRVVAQMDSAPGPDGPGSTPESFPHTPETTSTTTKEPPRPEVVALCDLLAGLIEENGSKRPNVTKAWLDACRLLLEKDDRTKDQVEVIILWSQRDDFWRANILSMPTLRRKFDQLRLARNRDLERRRPMAALGGAGRPSNLEVLADLAREA